MNTIFKSITTYFARRREMKLRKEIGMKAIGLRAIEYNHTLNFILKQEEGA